MSKSYLIYKFNEEKVERFAYVIKQLVNPPSNFPPMAELECGYLMSIEGMPRREIAKHRNTSARTIENLLRRLYNRIDGNSFSLTQAYWKQYGIDLGRGKIEELSVELKEIKVSISELERMVK